MSLQAVLVVKTINIPGGGGGGDFVADQQVALIVGQLPTGTAGSSSATTTWNVRTLNTEVYDDDNVVALSGTNGFALQPGEYLIEFSAPAHSMQRHQQRGTSTDSTGIIALGSSEFCDSNESSFSEGSWKVNIIKPTITCYIMLKTNNNNGLGVETSNNTGNIYSQIR